MLTAFLAGLGATNHTFMGFFAVAFGDLRDRARPAASCASSRLLAAAAAATVLGLLVYAYLPLRSRMDPALDWGNPETTSGFLDVVLRRGFWQRRFWEGPADIFPIGGDYLRGSAPSCSGSALSSRSPASSSRGAAAGRSCSCSLTAAANVAAWRCTARAATSSSGTATTFRPTW